MVLVSNPSRGGDRLGLHGWRRRRKREKGVLEERKWILRRKLLERRCIRGRGRGRFGGVGGGGHLGGRRGRGEVEGREEREVSFNVEL